MGQQDFSLLSGSEVARALRISETRVRQLAASGGLRAVRTRLGRLYEASEVAELAHRREAQRTASEDHGGPR